MVQRHRTGETGTFREKRANLFFRSKQQEANIGIPSQRDIGPLDDHAGSVIAAHRIEGDRDAVAHLCLWPGFVVSRPPKPFW
jgi:hypothetical protein